MKGQTEAVKCLLKFGANVSTAREQKLTALHWGVRKGHLSTVLVLIASGADVESRDENE